MTSNRQISVGLISLGCPKNLVDSELMMGSLIKEHFRVARSAYDCDIALINTCAYIDDAKKETIDHIFKLIDLKQKGKIRGLVVTGCFPQKYGKELKEEIPEVDACLGSSALDEIVPTIQSLLKGRGIYKTKKPSNPYNENIKRFNVSYPHSRYLKISEGCNHKCSFCTIPEIRGHYRSRPLNPILNEARRMLREGVKEINVIAQDITYYGMDTHHKPQLPKLIRSLDGLPGDFWIRLFYSYPSRITDELIEVIKKSKHVCHYLDLPLQHASDGVLKQMKRGITQSRTVKLIEKIKTKIPDIIIRTSFITGFPGEDARDFKCLMKFVEKTRFDKVGVFCYSDEESAPSFKLKKKVSKRLAEKRRDELMRLQQKISYSANRSLIGSQVKVLIDIPTNSKGVAQGRTYRDAIEIDGKVFVKSSKKLKNGDFVDVEIRSAGPYDVRGAMKE